MRRSNNNKKDDVSRATQGFMKDDESDEHDLRASLHLAVGKLCDKSTSQSSDENLIPSNNNKRIQVSSQAISVLTELTYQYATTSLMNDLVAFSRHANRKTITVDDVRLVTRKDPDLLLPALEQSRPQTKSSSGRSGGQALSSQYRKTGSVSRNSLSKDILSESNRVQKKRGKKNKQQNLDSSDDSSNNSSQDESSSDTDGGRINLKKTNSSRKKVVEKSSSSSSGSSDSGSESYDSSMASFISTGKNSKTRNRFADSSSSDSSSEDSSPERKSQGKSKYSPIELLDE